jgi:hypothetical protein
MSLRVYPWHPITKEELPPIDKPDGHGNAVAGNETLTPTHKNIPAGHKNRAVVEDKGAYEKFIKWEIVLDKRGTDYWTKDGQKHTIKELNIDVPDGCLTSVPSSPFHTTHDGNGWIIDIPMLIAARKGEREARINAFRWRIQRHRDEVDLGHALTEPLQPLLQYVQDLRDLPAQDGFPWPDGDVPWPPEPA